MELDLALDREEGALQASESGDLLDETVWLQQLEHWLKIVCGDESLDCPTLVRSAEELSLGLRFTDDANIADLNSAWRQKTCLLYTSPSPRDRTRSRMPSSA